MYIALIKELYFVLYYNTLFPECGAPNLSFENENKS